MPLRWASCLFRPTRSTTTSLEVNPNACPPELQEQLTLRGTACLRPRGSHILYERVDDAGQGAFTPPVVIYIKRLPVCGGLDVCIKRTLVTHFVCRAAREARLQVQLQHPHLLPALASVRGRHHYYLVLPAAEADLWAEVETMRQQGTGYSEEDLREITRQILLGLEHLHSSNLAHRDIKPANILRMPDGRVVVADFGCADACMSGFVAAGTAQFQPPECRRNAGAQLAVLAKGYDQRMQDMWSVGATLASLWFAQLPEVIRGTGSSRVPGAAAAAAAVAATAASRFGSTVGDVMAAAVCSPAAAGGESSGSSNGDASTPLAPIKPPLMLPPFLAAAGFGACASTVGARGEPMSEQLLDLLSRLLRIRPSERLTVTQALGHEWMLADKQVSTSMTNPEPVAAAAEAEAEAEAANLPPLQAEDAGTSVGERFMPFITHLQVVLHSTTSLPPVTLLTPRMNTALAAAGPMPEVEGLGGIRTERLIQDSPPTQQQLLRVQREQEPCHTCFGASPSSPSHPPPIVTTTNTVSASSPSSPSSRSSPSDTATQHSDGSRQQPHIYQKGRSGSPPSVLGHCHSHDGSSPLSQATRSPGEEAELFASRQRQRQQLQRQQQQQQQESPSSWLMRPSPSAHSHIPKRATQRAILRVFVGAGGESSGSN